MDLKRVWSWSMLPKCVWNHCQISMVKIRQHFALFSWEKSSSASPQVRCSAQNTILTKLSPWEYSNGDTPFSLWKSTKFCVWCAMALRQGFMPVYTMCANMDLDGQTVVAMHIIWHEYASTTIALSTYSCHKVQSTHG